VLGVSNVAFIGNPFLIVALLMLLTTIGIAYWVAGQASPPPRQRRWWSRFLIAAMHVAQPVERGWARYKTRFQTIEIPQAFHELRSAWERRAGAVLDRSRVELWSESWVPRARLRGRSWRRSTTGSSASTPAGSRTTCASTATAGARPTSAR
jgi:hypothetical protein